MSDWMTLTAGVIWGFCDDAIESEISVDWVLELDGVSDGRAGEFTVVDSWE